MVENAVTLTENASLISSASFVSRSVSLRDNSRLKVLSGDFEILKKGLEISLGSSVDNQSRISSIGGLSVGDDAIFDNYGEVTVTDKLAKTKLSSSKFSSKNGSKVRFQSDSVAVENVFSFYDLEVDTKKAILHNEGIILVEGELKVLPNKRLTTYSPGLKLEVLKTFSNLGEVELLSGAEDQGEIFLPTAVSGTIKIQKYIGASAPYWITSPVVTSFDALLRDGSFDPQYVRYWDPKVVDLVSVLNMSSTMKSGESYRIEFGNKPNNFISIANPPAVIELRGNPNVGDIALDLWYNSSEKSTSEIFRQDISLRSRSGWNTFGNPFPTTIDWEKIDKSPLRSPALYQLDNYGRILLYNQGFFLNDGSNFLPPFAGAKVRVSKNGKLILPKASRDIRRAGKTAIVDPNIPTVKLRFQELNSSGGRSEDYMYDECLFIVADGKYSGQNYDATKHIHPNGSIPNLYVDTDTSSFSMMTLPKASVVAPLSFQTHRVGKKYRVTADLKNIDPLWTVYLQDNLVRGLIDLRKPYEFVSSQALTSGNNSRFTFYLNQDAVVFNVDKTYTYVEEDEVRIVILDLDDNAEIDVYNSYGQILFSAQGVSDRETVFKPTIKRNVNRQIFIVKTIIKGIAYTNRVIY